MNARDWAESGSIAGAMIAIIRACGRALRSLFLTGMLKHFLWPVLASAVLWVGVGLALWGRLTGILVHMFQRWPFLSGRLSSGSGAELALSTSIHVALFLLSIPLMAVTAVLILELVALPIILDRVAETEYRHVERRGGGSQWQSLRNTAVSFLIGVVIALPTLPFWLVPGVGVVVSLTLSAWLNYRSFRYDVLMKHADTRELQDLPRAHRGRLFCMALAAGTLTLVPPINLLVVPFVGLFFAHYLLHALHQSRQAAPAEAQPRSRQ
jgi:CysZ protein